MTLCKDWYDRGEAEDLARHFGKMVNEESGIFCNPTPEALYQLRLDLISTAQQLRGAIDLIEHLRAGNGI